MRCSQSREISGADQDLHFHWLETGLRVSGFRIERLDHMVFVQLLHEITIISWIQKTNTLHRNDWPTCWTCVSCIGTTAIPSMEPPNVRSMTGSSLCRPRISERDGMSHEREGYSGTTGQNNVPRRTIHAKMFIGANLLLGSHAYMTRTHRVCFIEPSGFNGEMAERSKAPA
jgi:hypothetical protein